MMLIAYTPACFLSQALRRLDSAAATAADPPSSSSPSSPFLRTLTDTPDSVSGLCLYLVISPITASCGGWLFQSAFKGTGVERAYGAIAQTEAAQESFKHCLGENTWMPLCAIAIS